ncbi:hypothetical protein BGW38_001877 [Lunasporangiospora selenospora]|uniref:Uncharacterized protein n=1 Tax=Lunasporangiospora selenospora TaxID=979761 RepID=A0A9P6FT59_9FUNG|nr:hypothetical protein BGW38_001877 [Lunasporangiospora selenospora]
MFLLHCVLVVTLLFTSLVASQQIILGEDKGDTEYALRLYAISVTCFPISPQRFHRLPVISYGIGNKSPTSDSHYVAGLFGTTYTQIRNSWEKKHCQYISQSSIFGDWYCRFSISVESASCSTDQTIRIWFNEDLSTVLVPLVHSEESILLTQEHLYAEVRLENKMFNRQDLTKDWEHLGMTGVTAKQPVSITIKRTDLKKFLDNSTKNSLFGKVIIEPTGDLFKEHLNEWEVFYANPDPLKYCSKSRDVTNSRAFRILASERIYS